MAGFDKTQADELLALGQITPEQHAKFTVDTNLADAQPLPAPSADPNQSAWEQHVAEAKRKRDERAQTLGGEEDPDFVPAGLNRKSPMENYLIEKETDSVASGIESKQSEINAEREKYMAAGLTAEQANAMVKEKEAELDSIKKAVLPEHSLNPEVVGGIVPASAPAQEIEGPVQLAGDSVPGEIPGGGNFTEHLPQHISKPTMIKLPRLKRIARWCASKKRPRWIRLGRI